MHTHVVFCEFEGAIADADTTIAALEAFAAPESWAAIERMRAQGQIPADDLRQVLQSIPSSRYEEIVLWARKLELCDGLAELLDFLDEHESPLVVFTSGLRAIADAALGPLAPRIDEICGVEVGMSGPHFEPRSDFESATHLVDRSAIIRRHPTAEVVTIAATPLQRDADDDAQVVFAHGALADALNDAAVPYEPFRTFHDVRRLLERRWPVR